MKRTIERRNFFTLQGTFAIKFRESKRLVKSDMLRLRSE